MPKKKIWSNFQRIIELITPKIVTKLSKIWVCDPGSAIRKNLFRIPDPGSRDEKGTRSRIPDPNPQHWYYANFEQLSLIWGWDEVIGSYWTKSNTKDWPKLFSRLCVSLMMANEWEGAVVWPIASCHPYCDTRRWTKQHWRGRPKVSLRSKDLRL